MKSALIASLLISMAGGAAAEDTPNTLGEQVYNKWCAACHAAGDAYPGTLALRAKYRGAVPDTLVERRDLNPELIKYYVRNGISVMPFFRKTEIGDAELDALANFLAKTPSAK